MAINREPWENFESEDWDFLDSLDMISEMRKPCPTLRKVPPAHMRTVAAKLGNISNQAVHSPSALARERALKFFFLFPRLIFQAPLRNRHNGRNSKNLYHARKVLVGERLQSEPRVRFQEYQASLIPSESGLRRSARVQANQDFESHLSNEIMRQVHEGYISRASSLASSPGLARPGEATVQILRTLWSREPHCPTLPWTAPRNDVRTSIKVAIENKMHRSLRTASKGSGAGLSGWRFEYLFPLLRANSHVWDSFSDLAVAVAVGEVPVWVREVLSLGRATALKKGDAGVRPLVCHEPMRRLITRALVFESGSDIEEYLGPHQFAVGVAGGCPAMALSVKKLAHANDSLVFFKLDLVNAYNTQSRECALRNLESASPGLASFLRQFYGSGSQYFYRSGPNEHCIISAAEGIEQGDAAGPALFACGLKAPLDELRVELRRLIIAQRNYARGFEWWN